MALTTVTIGGVAKAIRLSSLNFSMAANRRSTVAFSIPSLDASYRPSLNDEVIIEEDGTRIFGGLVDVVRERGAAGESGVAIVTDISAVDFNVYPSRRYVSHAIPAGTLKAALVSLAAYYTPYGVTLDAGQVDGPTLPLLGYTVRTLEEVFNDLARLTSEGGGEPYVWRIDKFKVLSMFQPSSEPAPFDVEDPLPILEARSDITVETRFGSDYANRIIVYVPPVAQAARIESFTGDGTTTKFFLQYTPYANRGYVTSAGVFETLGGVGDGATWTYDPSDNSIERTSAPANGDAISIEIDGTFTALADAEDAVEIAAVGLWEKLVMPDELPDNTTAQAVADAELARSIYPRKTVTYTTLDAALEVGQSQVINVARRNINATGIVTAIAMRDVGKDLLARTVTVTVDGSQTNINRAWQDVYVGWNTGTRARGTAALVSGGVGTGQAGAAPPEKAVQYNSGGTFGGSADFTFDSASRCLAAGAGSSITATNVSSCQAFGSNCHIADP